MKKKASVSKPRLRVLGCGEAFDTGLGNNSSILYDGARGMPTEDKVCPTILFDCGYQIPERLWALPELCRDIDAVVLTHHHADHAFGLAPLLVRFAEEGRELPLGIFGPRGTATFCAKLLDLAYPGARQRLPYEIEFCEFADKDSVKWADLTLSCARSEHSVLNLAVRVEGPGISFAISGDGAMTDATRKLFEGVDVLFHETFSAVGAPAVHTDLGTLVKYVSKASIKRIGLTHVARGQKKTVAAAWDKLRKTDDRWFWLKPEMELTL